MVGDRSSVRPAECGDVKETAQSALNKAAASVRKEKKIGGRRCRSRSPEGDEARSAAWRRGVPEEHGGGGNAGSEQI